MNLFNANIFAKQLKAALEMCRLENVQVAKATLVFKYFWVVII